MYRNRAALAPKQFSRPRTRTQSVAGDNTRNFYQYFELQNKNYSLYDIWVKNCAQKTII